MAPAVATLLAAELGQDAAWAEAETVAFLELAQQYMLPTKEANSNAA